MRAAHILSITLPRHIWRGLKAARIRGVTRRQNIKEGCGQRAFGILFWEEGKGKARAARIRGVALQRGGGQRALGVLLSGGSPGMGEDSAHLNHGQRVFGALLCHGAFRVLFGDGTQMKGETY